MGKWVGGLWQRAMVGEWLGGVMQWWSDGMAGRLVGSWGGKNGREGLNLGPI